MFFVPGFVKVAWFELNCKFERCAMALVYDCFPFFNELELLEIRLNELDSVVDKFVLVEATRNFQKKEKPLIFEQNKKKFEKFLPKIEHIVVDKYPNFFTHFRVPKTWDYENHQRDQVKLGLRSCQPEDVIILSDIDEIPKPEAILKYKDEKGIKVFQHKMYWYFLDNFIVDYDEPVKLAVEGYKPWHGAVMCHYQDFSSFKKLRGIKNREDLGLTFIPDGGWHYSWLGGVDKIITKMEAYAHKEHNKDEYKDPKRIVELLKNGGDLFGRNVKTQLVDPFSEAPKYLQLNAAKFKHLTLAELVK